MTPERRSASAPDAGTSPSPASRFPGGGGSRRDEAARARVLVATNELLAEVGYGDLTIEAVATRAAVGKPTIYRWWKNKAHLAYEAACTSAMSEVPEDTGDLDVDLRAFVERVEGFLCREEVSAAFRGMLTDPWVLNQVSERLILPAREHLGRIIERAGGAVRPDLDVRAFYDLAVGAIVNRALQPSSGRQRPRQWVDSIVTMLIDAVRA